jgi:hypothetical protein
MGEGKVLRMKVQSFFAFSFLVRKKWRKTVGEWPKEEFFASLESVQSAGDQKRSWKKKLEFARG